MSNDLEIGIYKGRDGWSARSRVALDGYGLPGRILEISTDKWANGGIWCQAISIKMVSGSSFIWEPSSDWNKILFREPKTRCTEKNVREMQKRAIVLRDELIAECVAFYIKKEAA